MLDAARELGYRPNAFARSLASKRVHTIGVLVNDVTNPYFGALYASLARAATAAGYTILTAPGTRVAKSEAGLVNTLLEHRVEGLALLSPLMSLSDLRSIVVARPTVVVGREVGLAEVDVVTTDEEETARNVVGHLVSLGHRHIAHITGGGNRPAKDRASGYRHAMTEAGLEPVLLPGAFTAEGGSAAAQAILKLRRRPTAVIAANDLTAVGAMGTFRNAGLQMPDDISVVGYDDSQIARLDLVQLTSVRQDIEQFGKTAISTLIGRIEQPHREPSVQRLGTTLVERGSTGAAPTPARP